jgi:hypothetical protein
MLSKLKHSIILCVIQNVSHRIAQDIRYDKEIVQNLDL